MCVCVWLPVGQAQDEELQERRVEEQVLVVFGQGGEARNLVGPTSDHLHRSGQEVVELTHVLSVVPHGAPWSLLRQVKGHQRDSIKRIAQEDTTHPPHVLLWHLAQTARGWIPRVP